MALNKASSGVSLPCAMNSETFRGRLNPFAFRSETALRSILLVCAVSGLCWNVGYFFAMTLANAVQWPLLQELPNAEWEFLHVRDYESLTPDALAGREQALAEALAELGRPQARAEALAAIARLKQQSEFQFVSTLPYIVIPIAFLILIGLLAGLLYVVRFLRMQLLRRLTSASRMNEPEFHQAIYHLIEEARALERENGGASLRCPDVLISPGHRGSGQALGVFNRSVLILPRSLRLFLRRDLKTHGVPNLVRAIVFHELAHFANRDAARAFWAQASRIVLLTVAFLLIGSLALFPSAAGPFATRQNPILVSLHFVTLLVVIELIRRSILRNREHYADLRAGLLWGADGPIRTMLGESSDNGQVRGRAWAQGWARLWSRHPTREERRKILDNSDSLFAITGETPLLTGLLFGNLFVAVSIFTAVLTLAAHGLSLRVSLEGLERYAEVSDLAAAIHMYYRVVPLFAGSITLIALVGPLAIVSYLLAGTLGVQVQRESVLQLAQGHSHPYRKLLIPAFLTALGLEIGLTLVPLTPALPDSFLGIFAVFLWVVFATFPLWLWLAATRFLARFALGRSVGGRKPTRKLRFLTLASTMLFWALSATLVGGQFWIWPHLKLIDGKAALIMGVLGLSGFITLLALFLFSLGAREALRPADARPRCPHCGGVPGISRITAYCDFCGGSLAPWLLFSEEPREEAKAV